MTNQLLTQDVYYSVHKFLFLNTLPLYRQNELHLLEHHHATSISYHKKVCFYLKLQLLKNLIDKHSHLYRLMNNYHFLFLQLMPFHHLKIHCKNNHLAICEVYRFPIQHVHLFHCTVDYLLSLYTE